MPLQPQTYHARSFIHGHINIVDIDVRMRLNICYLSAAYLLADCLHTTQALLQLYHVSMAFRCTQYHANIFSIISYLTCIRINPPTGDHYPLYFGSWAPRLYSERASENEAILFTEGKYC